MSDNVHPAPYDEGSPVGPHRPGALQEPWLDDDDGEGGAQALKRVLAALGRYRWLLVASVVVGAGVGYFAYQQGSPVYEADGAFWVVQSRNTNLQGPVQQAELLGPTAWAELMRTEKVLLPVVIQERLYYRTAFENRNALSTFEIPSESRYAPGSYLLRVAETGGSWELLDGNDRVVDQGTVGSAVGEDLGFRWTPPSGELEPGREIPFQVFSIVDAMRNLNQQITAAPSREGNFVNLTLRGRDPEHIASVLSAVMAQLQEQALSLKRVQLDSVIAHLDRQLRSADSTRAQAQQALMDFEVSTATLPLDQSTPVAAGLQSTQSTVMGDFYRRRFELEDLQREKSQLEDLLGRMRENPDADVPVVALERIPAVQASSELSNALSALVEDRATLNKLRQDFTDEWGPVQDLQARVDRAEREQIPALVESVIGQLEAQESAANSLLSGREEELTQIPARSIQQLRLQDDLDAKNALFREIQTRLETNRLAKASTQNDLQVITQPRVPNEPAQDERIRLFLLAFFACVGVGAGAAILLDRMDPRFRYPAEVNRLMGLEILGAIPRIKARQNGNAGQVLEAFREIRMRVQYAYGQARPLVMSVTSPESGEGKTFVSANLAITFAQLGKKTLVIDADTRRGDMHDLFQTDRKPGLTDLFRRTVDHSVIQKTQHENLHFLPCGSRFAESPELLSSGDMQELLAAAKRRYEIIIIDCPPLAAGSDAFVLGAHAGSVLTVLRSGSTHKELAKAKMEAFYRLPVRLLGAVLNDIDAGSTYGAYRYYSYYLPGYQAGREEEEEESEAVAL